MQHPSRLLPVILAGSILTLFGAGCGGRSPSTPVPPSQPQPVSGAPAEAAGNNKSYALADVAKHNTEQDCWLVIRDGVYDVTSFIPRHPGGADALIRNCGKDATVAFETRPNGPQTPHPQRAEDMLGQFQIGTLAK